MKKLLFIYLAALPLLLNAGDPIPGIDITVEQSGTNIILEGKTDAKGEWIVTGLEPGPVRILLKRNDKMIVIGEKTDERIVIPETDKASIKPIRIELVAYQPGEGDDIVLRKKPGRKSTDSDDAAEKKAEKAKIPDCKEVMEVTYLPGGKMRMKITCENIDPPVLKKKN